MKRVNSSFIEFGRGIGPIMKYVIVIEAYMIDMRAVYLGTCG